jgi:hypothetical protein
MEKYAQQLKEMPKVLYEFLKNPIHGIRHLPDWPYEVLVITQVIVAVISGALNGIVSMSVISFVLGIIITPIVTLVMAFVTSLLLYYVFLVWLDRQLPFRKLITLVLFANIPFFIFQTVSGLVPPITLVGFGFASLLLIVGLVDNFSLPRKQVIRVVGVIYAVFLIIWIWGRIQSIETERHWSQQIHEYFRIQA